MGKSTAFASNSAIIDQSFQMDDLKMSFLWYDEILWQNLRVDLVDNFLNIFFERYPLSRSEQKIFTDILVPISDRIKLNELPELTHGYPRVFSEDRKSYALEKFYHYPDPSTPEQFAHNKLLSIIEQEHNVISFKGIEVEWAEGQAALAIDNVKRWEFINQIFPSFMLSTKDEKAAMIALSQFRGNDKRIEPVILFQQSIPSLETVPWKSIIELKRNGAFDSLRRKLKNLLDSSSYDLTKAKIELEEEEKRATEEIIDKYRPNIKKTSIESVLSNIPTGPIPNPAGLFLGGRAIKKEIEKSKNYEWFYLLRDIKKAPNNV